MSEIKFGSRRIQFERKPAKSQKIVTLRILPDKSVFVMVRPEVDDSELESLVSTKSKWILEKFQNIDEVVKTNGHREFVSGEGFLIKGRLLRLKVVVEKELRCDRVFSDTTSLFCRVREPSESRVRKALLAWYRETALDYLPTRTYRLARRLTKRPLHVGVRDQAKRWGSCTKDGRVLFNWRVIMAPPSVIDYVIVHELVHLGRKQHSKGFWDQVGALMPNYKEKKEWLRVNGPLLSLSSSKVGCETGDPRERRFLD